MNAQDKQAFLDLVTAAYEIHGKSQPSNPVLRMWWKMLSQFPIEAVEYGIQSAMANSKYLITPAVVLEQLQGSDGRPDADEAWAIAKQAMDERSTVVWNDEIAEAYGIACEVYHEDNVGGRMAFRSAYERIVEQNRSSGASVKWWPTLGDPSTRKIALEQAEEKGLLSHDQVVDYLPTSEKPIANNVVALLADEFDGGAEKAKEHISELRSILGVKK